VTATFEKVDNSAELIPTRHSLLSRLKDSNDQESWKHFFDTYWKLIYTTAIRAGLNSAEAEDVVQETVMSVFKSIPKFEYDNKRGSFKTWLLRLTQWRIQDQFRKRQRDIKPHYRSAETGTDTATVERVIDPVGSKLEEMWDEEFEANLLQAAAERVKKKVDPKQYQIFDLYVTKKWPVSKVASTLQINSAQVYLIKHRIGSLIKKEVNYLREKPI
jgi:RNA polymerase sigma factor (sigma-70 family)